MDVTREFRSAEQLYYPGKMNRSKGVVQEIGSYTESVQHMGRSLQTLSLSINRNVSWGRPTYKLKPHKYSARVKAFHPLIPPNSAKIEGYPQMISVAAIAESREHFIKIASGLEGFVKTEPLSDDEQLTTDFYNNEKDTIASWNIYVNRDLPGVSLSVNCLDKVSSLDAIVQKTVPYLVSVFNRFELTRHITGETVAEVSRLAYAGDKMTPQCAIKRAS